MKIERDDPSHKGYDPHGSDLYSGNDPVEDQDGSDYDQGDKEPESRFFRQYYLPISPRALHMPASPWQILGKSFDGYVSNASLMQAITVSILIDLSLEE
jgi:hypothetical protein